MLTLHTNEFLRSLMNEIHFYCTDYPGEQAQRLRKKHLHDHLDYIEANMSSVSVAGPLLDENNERIIGSCVIFHTATVAEARRLFEQDPYFKAGGIWQAVEVRVFRTVAGTWVGGKQW